MSCHVFVVGKASFHFLLASAKSCRFSPFYPAGNSVITPRYENLQFAAIPIRKNRSSEMPDPGYRRNVQSAIPRLCCEQFHPR